MRKTTVAIAALSMLMSLGAGGAAAAEVSDEPDLLTGFCYAFTYDTDAELIWLFQIHDPATGCLDGFPFDGHEITIENLSDGVLWNVFGFDEGNILQLEGVIPSAIYAFDADAFAAGTPLFAFLTADRLVAAGPVNMNLNIIGTQADGNGTNVMHLVFHGEGTIPLVGGGDAAFTAAVHEEVNTTANGLTASELTARISLREIG